MPNPARIMAERRCCLWRGDKEKGIINNVKVIRGVHKLLDEEAVRVVSMSPAWTPGKHKGESVSVVYVFPVIFQLR